MSSRLGQMGRAGVGSNEEGRAGSEGEGPEQGPGGGNCWDSRGGLPLHYQITGSRDWGQQVLVGRGVLTAKGRRVKWTAHSGVPPQGPRYPRGLGHPCAQKEHQRGEVTQKRPRLPVCPQLSAPVRESPSERREGLGIISFLASRLRDGSCCSEGQLQNFRFL